MLFAFILLSIPVCLQAQASVDLVESVTTSEGKAYSYRIVGASYSAIDKLKRFEAVNSETHTFSSFSFDESTHICRVEVGTYGGDRGEAQIRYYIKEAVGALEEEVQEDRSEWDDDDPRHGMGGEDEPQTAIPEPTDPSTMPDWSHLLKQDNSSDQDGGDE